MEFSGFSLDPQERPPDRRDAKAAHWCMKCIVGRRATGRSNERQPILNFFPTPKKKKGVPPEEFRSSDSSKPRDTVSPNAVPAVPLPHIPEGACPNKRRRHGHHHHQHTPISAAVLPQELDGARGNIAWEGERARDRDKLQKEMPRGLSYTHRESGRTIFFFFLGSRKEKKKAALHQKHGRKRSHLCQGNRVLGKVCLDSRVFPQHVDRCHAVEA